MDRWYLPQFVLVFQRFSFQDTGLQVHITTPNLLVMKLLITMWLDFHHSRHTTHVDTMFKCEECSIEHSSHFNVMSTCVVCLLWWKSSHIVIRSFITNRLGVVMCTCNPVSWKLNLWKTITNCGRYHLSIHCNCLDNDSLVTQWDLTLWLMSYVPLMSLYGPCFAFPPSIARD